MANEISQSDLNLTPEERRLFGQLFRQADTEGLGVVTGDVAVKFFERTNLDSSILGEIWQIADTENRGLLTPSGFSVALRLIGHCQAGREPSPANIKRSGPLPWFESIGSPNQPPASPVRSNTAGSLVPGPTRVPPLTSDKVAEYSSLFERAGARNGMLSGDIAKQIFEKSRLPNEVLGRIWNLSDTQQRGALALPQFVIAMHLLTSIKNGSLRSLPQSLPAGLFDAASRRAPAPSQTGVLRQLTGQQESQRAQSPLTTTVMASPLTQTQIEAGDWLVSPTDKAKFDQIFATIDTSSTGFMTGDQAVPFFSTSGLSEDTLAQIWDLADINSEGRLNKDEFAVAMFLIRQQRGKKDGRGDLPQSLPPKLIPVSMRKTAAAPAQPTAPSFDNVAFAPQLPKSAAEDLFGLDAMAVSEEMKPLQQSSIPSSPKAPIASRSNPTAFKPFTPTSSFGQGLANQTTGASHAGSLQGTDAPLKHPAASAISTNEDLLGDNDPEESSKLTAETTELANMSNQIGTLRNQMQEVHTKRTTFQSDLSSSTSQKRDLETRLAQFRSQYEQEIREVKALEEQLNVSRAETRKAQKELAMIEGTLQDLQAKHKEVSAALESDKQENNSLKEKIRDASMVIAELKSQLEKLRSKARQHKGLVAINKKQFSSIEIEQDKLRSEKTELEKSNADTAAASKRSVEPESTPPVTSPALSTPGQHTNPFFRQNSQASVDRVISPSVFAQDAGASQDVRQVAFDNLFGPSQVSHATDSTAVAAEVPRSVTPPTGEEMTYFSTPSRASQDDSSPLADPPAPPKSQQITSSVLPLRTSMLRTDSISSSVKANPPASRGGPSPSATPVKFARSPASSVDGNNDLHANEPKGTAGPFEVTEKADAAGVPSQMMQQVSTDELLSSSVTTAASLNNAIPGAFPGDTPTVQTPNENVMPSTKDETALEALTPKATEIEHDPFEIKASEGREEALHDKTIVSEANGLEPSQPVIPMSHANVSPSSSVAGRPANRSSPEFPPIQEIEQDSDSDSDSETGFEDNFTTTPPPRETRAEKAAENEEQTMSSKQETLSTHLHQPTGSPALSSANNALPTLSADKSPPSYSESSSRYGEKSQETTQFPPEYSGLLPSREVVLHGPPESSLLPSQPDSVFASAETIMERGLDGKDAAAGSSVENSKAKASSDDFDSAFDDLDEAKVADETNMDAFTESLSGRNDEHEFNPVFDSPTPSKAPTTDLSQATQTRQTGSTNFRVTDAFTNFETSLGDSTRALYGSGNNQQPLPPPSISDDWDTIFSSLDKTSDFGQGNGKIDQHFALDEAKSDVATVGRTEDSRPATHLKRPVPARGMSSGSANDDPILKTLTSMGYKRDDALKALEKYDYNIDRAVEYLTSRS